VGQAIAAAARHVCNGQQASCIPVWPAQQALQQQQQQA
jgi:hypothetical protein